MLQLIKTEWLKLKKYPAFWALFGIVALSYPSVNYMFHFGYKNMTTNPKGKNDLQTQAWKMLLDNPFSFPEAWHSVAFFSSLFVFIPALLVIMLIANEYTYKTHRQNIIDGWSRSEFVTSKLLSVLLISSFTTLLYIIIAAIFGYNYSSEFSISRWDEQLKYIPLFFLQTFAQLTLAFLVGFLVKRSFIALGIFIFYYLMVENILAGLVTFKSNVPKLANFFPLELSDKLIPPPAFRYKFDESAYNQALYDINPHIIYTIIFTGLIWFLCYKVYQKRDL